MFVVEKQIAMKVKVERDEAVFKIRQEANDFGLRPDKSGGGEQQLAFLRSSAEKIKQPPTF